jgi:predicted ATP-grasp superfamily ATP-dependent carboligase
MSTPRDDGPGAGTVILTFARGWQTLVATRSLGRRGVEVVIGDEYPMTPASFSRYAVDGFLHPNVTEQPEAFLDVLEQVVIRHKPADDRVPYVLMPVHKETYQIARHRERFEPHIRVPLSDIDVIELVHDKGRLAELAMQRGLPIPPTWLPRDTGHLQVLLPEIEPPVFLKLRASAAGVGIRKVKTREELVAAFRELVERFRPGAEAQPIVQRAVPGDDYCVTTLFDRGRLVTSMTYHNLRAFPAEKGASVMRETVVAPQMERIAADLLGPLGWHGVAELDFRWDGQPESSPYLIEVNPRFWGGLIQAVESGWDYPWLLFQLAAQGHVEFDAEVRHDVRTETPVLALLATLQELSASDRGLDKLAEAWHQARHEVVTGSKRAALRKLLGGVRTVLDPKARLAEARRLFKEHEGNVYDILSSSDPLPALGMLYPLAVFLRHGKLNLELITGETGPGPGDE